jgi:hypothetical protein
MILAALEWGETVGLVATIVTTVGSGVGLVWKFMSATVTKQAENHQALVRSVQEDTRAARVEAQTARVEFTSALKGIGEHHEAAIGRSMVTLERVEAACAKQRDEDRAMILKLAKINSRLGKLDGEEA